MARLSPCLAAFVLLSIAAPTAAAACKGPELRPVDTVALGGSTWKVGYICWNSCRAGGGSAPVLEEITLVGRYEMQHCRSRCSARNDCYNVSYHDTVVFVDGREERARICRLYGRGTIETTNASPNPDRPFDFEVVCLKDKDQSPPWQRDLDLDKFHQDQRRPGVPGPSVPTKP